MLDNLKKDYKESSRDLTRFWVNGWGRWVAAATITLAVLATITYTITSIVWEVWL